MIGEIFQGVVRQADMARDAKQYRKAALLYEKALQDRPTDAAIHIQCGHMFKEAGELGRAEQHYDSAKQLTPEDPDLALQLGHFYKTAGRLQDAERAYRQAMGLDPEWPEPAIQLAELYRMGWRGQRKGNRSEASNGRASPRPADGDVGGEYFHANRVLVPELAPQPPESKLHGHNEETTIRWLGRRERTPWGERSTLRGVDAIRGFCISALPLIEVRASLNGLRFYAGPVRGYPLKYEKDDPNKEKYVFNIWHNFSHFSAGLYDLQLQFIGENSGMRIHGERIVIAAPLSEDQYPNSDRLVSIAGTDTRPIEEQINSRPSMIRPATRRRFASPPRNVLVQRVDQLGDMVVSIAALRRLRELLPEARIVGLLSGANADLAKTLGLFDEIVIVEFPDDEWERRRTMPLDRQEELRQRLEGFKFDVAIDLAEADVSRPLLQLSGAPFRIGFWDGWCQWLSATYGSHTSDPLNGWEEIPPSTKALGLVEWFGTLLRNRPGIIQRRDIDRSKLGAYGLSAQARFVVLHGGARLKYSRWPHYAKLAAMILEKTDLQIVMLIDDPAMRSTLPRELVASNRFRLLDQPLPFDDFDALLSFCTVFVGNDSGPAHLASLRGTNVVNLFLARHNWNEWGHENNGYIVSRRVPCAGCNIHHDPEECGKDFACLVHISPEEVFGLVMKFL